MASKALSLIAAGALLAATSIGAFAQSSSSGAGSSGAGGTSSTASGMSGGGTSGQGTMGTSGTSSGVVTSPTAPDSVIPGTARDTMPTTTGTGGRDTAG